MSMFSIIFFSNINLSLSVHISILNSVRSQCKILNVIWILKNYRDVPFSFIGHNVNFYCWNNRPGYYYCCNNKNYSVWNKVVINFNTRKYHNKNNWMCDYMRSWAALNKIKLTNLIKLTTPAAPSRNQRIDTKCVIKDSRAIHLHPGGSG